MSMIRHLLPRPGAMIIAGTSFLTACGATPAKVTADLGQCLKPGQTTFADAILCLGVPSRSFEDGRILVYPGLRKYNSVGFSIKPPRSGFETPKRDPDDLDFVLSFDSSWVLRDFRLVSSLDGH